MPRAAGAAVMTRAGWHHRKSSELLGLGWLSPGRDLSRPAQVLPVPWDKLVLSHLPCYEMRC